MSPSPRQSDRLFAGLILLIHVLLMLPGFVRPGGRVLCFGLNDVAKQFAHWRAFAAEAWRAGEAPLWCPLTFGGQAFLGNFQSAALYPLNAPYLILPLHLALNLEMMLHLALFALGVFALGRRWGVSPAGSFLAAMTASFGGPHFQAFVAGHLTIITTLAWMPVLLLVLHNIALPLKWGRHPACQTRESASANAAADKHIPATANASWGWALGGAAALAMQVLAGHPQMVYFTLLTGGLYFALVWILRCRWAEDCVTDDQKNDEQELNKNMQARTSALLTALAQAGVIVALGFGLAAFQLAAGFAALGDIERGGGYDLEAARAFSPSPETLLTILFPDILGNDMQTPYWGRHRYLNFFIGVIPLALAVIGFVRGPRAPRRTAAAMTAILFLLMIAGLTPLFAAVYHGLPGYGLFRGYYRWSFFWSVFAALAAGMGFDVVRAGLITANKNDSQKNGSIISLPVRLLGGMAGLGAALVVAALAARAMSGPDSALGEAWARWFARFHSDPSQFVPQALHNLTPESPGEALRFALRNVTMTGLTLLVAGGLPLLARRLPPERRGRAAALLLALGAAEGFIYSAKFIEFTPASDFRFPADVEAAVTAHVKPPERCIIFAGGFENMLMPLGISSPAGYDQFVPRRMGAFLERSQREFDAPTFAGRRALALSDYHPRMRLLRVGHALQIYTLAGSPGELVYRGELMNLFRVEGVPLPEALLVERWRRADDLDAALDSVFAPEFDPAAEALVEGALEFPPGAVAASVQPLDAPFARVTQRSVNSVEVEAWTPREALLVLTDGFMRGWRAESTGDAKFGYEILPADGALMGVGLGPGLHNLKLIYWPKLLTIGLWMNVFAGILFLAGIAHTLRCWKRKLRNSV